MHVISQLHRKCHQLENLRDKPPTSDRASLIAAALTMAAERSPAHITTGDLAAAVGISQGAVFRHFPSKEAIWLAVMGWVTEQLMGRLHAAVQVHRQDPGAFNPLAALQDAFIAHVDFVMAHPGVPRIAFQELQHPQETALKHAVRGLMEQYRALVAGLLQDAISRDLLAPETNLASATVLFLGSVQGLVMQSLVGGNVQTMAAQAPGVFSIYFRGIARKESP